MPYAALCIGSPAVASCQCELQSCHMQQLCSRALYLFEGIIRAMPPSECLCAKGELRHLEATGISYCPAHDVCGQSVLTIHLQGHFFDAAGRCIPLRFALALKANPAHAQTCCQNLSAAIRLLHARHVRDHLFEICAQIMLTQTNAPCNKTVHENMPLYPKPIYRRHGNFC